MDAGFIQYLRDQRGFQPGDTIATKQQYDAMYKQYLKDTSGGGANFQPSAVAITNPVNTNQVVPFVTTSPNSVQPFPQERFKEGPVENGTQLVFDPQTGTYFPGTNMATKTVVKPEARPNRMEEIMGMMGNAAPEEAQPGLLSRIFGGVPASTPAPTPESTPMPSPTPAAVTNAATPAPTPTVFTAEQYKQMSGGQQLPPGTYADANGRPFTIR
jgi:hypothetical protein